MTRTIQSLLPTPQQRPWHRTIKSVLLISSLFAAAPIFANTDANTDANTSEQHCFAQVTLEPSFVAFTTSKDSKLDRWYKNLFGLTTVKEFSFPDGSVDGLLMRRGEFVVEVFKRSELLKASSYEPQSKPADWAGVKKVGIYSDADLDSLKQCLQAQDIKAGRIYNDKNLGIRLLHISDPEGNSLEIISRIPSSQ